MEFFVVNFPSFFSLKEVFKTKNLYFCSFWKIRAIFLSQAEKHLTACGSATSNWTQGSRVPLFPLQQASVPEEMAKTTKLRHRGGSIGVHGQIHFPTIPNNPDWQCKISEGYTQNSSKYKILEAISEARQIIKVFSFYSSATRFLCYPHQFYCL